MLIPLLSFCADIECHIPVDASSSDITIYISDIDYTEFLEIINEGYSSEIVYTFRVRKKSIFGTLSSSTGRNSWSVVKTASREFLTDMFLIDTDGERSAFQNTPEFIEAFFSCSSPNPSTFIASDDDVLEVRATADLIIRPAPLSLLDPFFRSEITQTGWFRIGD